MRSKIIDSEIMLKVKEAIKKSDMQIGPVVLSHTIHIDTVDLLPILTHPADRYKTRIYLERPSSEFAMAAMGNIITIDYDNGIESILEKIKIIKSNMVYKSGEACSKPAFLGGHAFNPYAIPDETWKTFPRGRLVLPECLATKDENGTWMTISTLVKSGEKQEKVFRRISDLCIHYQNRMPVTLPPIVSGEVDKFRDVPNHDTYADTIHSILEKLKPGHVEKVVLSRSHHVKIDQNFSSVSAMQVLRNAYPNCMSFFYSFPNKGIFFGSTPERLIKLNDDYFETEALAGTIARGKNMEEDRLLSETLLESHKEREEHRYVLEQLQRKLSGLCNDLESSEIPQIFKLKNVQHLKTPIYGSLNSKMHILELVNRIHPTPAVAGTPTVDAISIIEELETHDRGWYSGPIGWSDIDGNGEFYVGLRSALVSANEAHVFAGGGIVSESIAQREWEETELKIQPILSALSGGQI